MVSHEAFLFVYVTAFVIVELLLGALFTLRARMEASTRMAWLAAAYAWTAPLAILNTIVLVHLSPDVSQVASTYYYLWHLGWPVLLGAYAFSPERSDRRSMWYPIIAFVLALAVSAVAYAARHQLPVFVTGGIHFSSVAFAFTTAVLILNAGVFVRLVLRRRASESWVALAVAFAVVEACVTLLTPERFTLLYFAGRIAAFFSAASLLGAVVLDALAALRQSTLASQELRLAERSALLATISESLYESLELEVVLRRATTAPVPGFADRVIITMHEEGDEEVGAPPVNPDSSIVVPLQLGGQIFGTMTFLYAESGRVYRGEDRDLFEEIARRVALAIDHAARFAQERRIAEALQRASLPATLPILDGVSLDAVYQAARADERVGGDWYDAFEVAGGKLVVTVGDVMGSGVDAAVTMNAVRQSIRGVAQVTFDPATILNAAGRALGENAADRIVTAFVGVLDLKSGMMTYASAGHPPACIRSNDGSIAMLGSTGVPLGVAFDELDDHSLSTELRSGDLLVLYTDGLTELHRDPLSGEQELVAYLRQIPDSASAAEEIRKALIAGDPYDDVAILTLRMLGGREQNGFSVDIQDGIAAARVRHSVVDLLRAKGMTGAALFNAEVIVGELLGNVAKHARGMAEIYVDFDDGVPALRVLDRGNGPPFAPHVAAAAEESGRGLFLVTQLGLGLRIAPRPGGGSEVSVMLSVEGADPPSG